MSKVKLKIQNNLRYVNLTTYRRKVVTPPFLKKNFIYTLKIKFGVNKLSLGIIPILKKTEIY